MKVYLRALAALAVLVLLAAGCADVPGSPSVVTSASVGSSSSAGPTSGSYQRLRVVWTSGSVPPPYNYGWAVEVTGTSGTLTWKTRYSSSDQTWTASFAVPAGGLDAAAGTIVSANNATTPESGPPAVGGSSASFEVVAADGQTTSAGTGGIADPHAMVHTLQDTAQRLVPPEVWQQTEAKYQAWQQAHR